MRICAWSIFYGMTEERAGMRVLKFQSVESVTPTVLLLVVKTTSLWLQDIDRQQK